MTKLKLKLSLRMKIVALLTAALSVSLLSYLYVGTSLIIEDKTSYIYDFNLAKVNAIANMAESHVQKIVTSASVMAHLTMENGNHPNATVPQGSAPNLDTLNLIFEKHSNALGVEGLIILKPETEEKFAVAASFGPAKDALSAKLGALGWTPKTFTSKELLVGSSEDGHVVIGGKTENGAGKPVAFVGWIKIDKEILGTAGKGFEIRLLDSNVRALAIQSGETPLKEDLARKSLEVGLMQGAFGSGVRDWENNGHKYMVSYHRILKDQLLVVSYIERDIAFAAAKALIQRSLVLSISILLLAIGVTLAFVKGLTARLKELWVATEQVSQGDFSVRLNASKGQNDEISGLASSFNAMANKIDELMIQTADKARMEKELETAQAVQSRFFPAEPFAHANINLSGKYVPASECAGDWWHYHRKGDYLYIVVGDVTGHGVSAALVTAAAHGTFSVLMQHSDDIPPTPEMLVTQLNTAICAAGGDSTMTFFLSVIDLQTGLMTVANASHCPPYVYAGAGEGRAISRFKPLIAPSADALGSSREIQIETKVIQLVPGQRVFWYTDGLMDQRISDSVKMSKSELFGVLAKFSDEKGTDASAICDSIIDETLQFFGGAQNRPDDITLVVASIPPDAQFNTLSVAAA